MDAHNSTEEIWGDPPANLNLSKYQVSKTGKIRNKRTNMILKSYSKGIYSRIKLHLDDNTRKFYQVHRLVAMTHIPNPENKPTVDHINRNTHDNNINNLRWANQSEQNINRVKYKHKERKIIMIYSGNIIKIWNSMSDATSEFPSIQYYLDGVKYHEGYIFSYLDKTILPGEFFRGVNTNGVITYVSTLGRIYREKYNKLTYGNNTNGYMTCKINNAFYYVSRLIGFAFVERPLHLINIPYEQLEINHIDGNKENNVFNNLEWVTPSENIRHAINNLHRDRMRIVTQYDLNGKFIANYRNSVEAAKAINQMNGDSHIRKCCTKIVNIAYNYIWRYYGDELETLPRIRKSKIQVLQYNLRGEFIREYPTISEASRTTGITMSSIRNCCKSEHKTSGEFIWREKS